MVDRLRGQNIPPNAKSIDRTVGMHTVVSHKSTDLRLRSYRSPNNVYAAGTSFVRKLAAYSGETRRDHKINATYFLQWPLEEPNSRRVLEWFVPLEGVAPEQELALKRVIEYGAKLRVEVVIYRVAE